MIIVIGLRGPHQPLGGFPLVRDVAIDWQMMRRGDIAIHIELENAGHHDDRLRLISILKHCELEGFRTIDEQPATEASLVLDYPVPSAVLTDEELQRPRTWNGRGRFSLFHDTFPC
jgi:hypothetical protein